jgi:hypothetical protein
MDSNPNIEKSEEYFKALKQIFPFVIKTTSLSHSYLTAIQNSKADFLFMLEHDWTFIKKRIHHNLDEIILEFPNIIHLRFNKMKNHSNSWESIEEKLNSGYPYCKTDMLSNNPHIIKRLDYHIATKDLLVIESGSFGIEENLSNKGLSAGIYGAEGYKRTIKHTDGRNNIIKRFAFFFLLDFIDMINENTN